MRVLIVDDSALMRRMLAEAFANRPGVEIAIARDGAEALERVAAFNPDVVTLDVNMPVMDGLRCLAKLMETAPRPVVMVSALTEEGARVTLEALELGAVDFVAKPTAGGTRDLAGVLAELADKVAAAAGARPVRPAARRPAPPHPAAPRSRPIGPARIDLVLVGVSTGGPRALAPILETLPAGFPAPILIAQHMPERFTRVFAERMDRGCAIAVRELDGPEALEPGVAYVIHGGRDGVVSRRAGRLTAASVDPDPARLWRPSVGRMVASALEAAPAERLVGVQLTGMGDDGAAEMAELRRRGGRTIAESQETATVFGMPNQLIQRGGATVVLPCHAIAEQIIEWATRSAARTAAACS